MSKNKNRSLTDALVGKHTTTAILNSLFISSSPLNSRKCVFRLAVIKHGAVDGGFKLRVYFLARVRGLMATLSLVQSI